jgi:hypothetical protein
MASHLRSCICSNAGTSVIVLLLLLSAFVPGGVPPLHAQQSAGPMDRGPVFRKGPSYSTEGLFSHSVAAGDFNGDGKLDLVVTNECRDFFHHFFCGIDDDNGSVTVRLGNGNGTFGRAVISSAGNGAANSVVVGDLNPDGNPDLGIASLCVGDPLFDFFGEVHSLIGNGDGTFNNFFTFPTFRPCPEFAAIGDFNLDGNLDLAVTYFCTDPPACTAGAVAVFLGIGDGNFQDPVFYDGGDGPQSLSVGDFNDDGKPDLAVGDNLGGVSQTVTVLLGNGDGTFQTGEPFATPTGFSVTFVVGDFNGDGTPDLAGASGNNRMALLLGNGDGTFQSGITTEVSSGAGAFAAADFNCDGKLDLAISGTGGVTVLLGNGEGAFHAVRGSDGTGILAVADFNGDGKPDLAIDDGSRVGIFLNVFHGSCRQKRKEH